VSVPLVLLPGLLCDALLWQSQIAGLADDAADCWVPRTTEDESMPELAARVLRDSPFERFALAGLSMGGYIALEILRQAPQRVSRLALLDTSARPDTPEQSRKRNDFIELAESGQFAGVTEAVLPQWVHPDRLADRALIATVKSMARNVGKAAFIRQERAIMSRIDSRPHLGAIACPTLVLCGREDASTPPALHEEIARGIPHARLVLIERCGHLSVLERPEAATAALEGWLGAAGAASSDRKEPER
jgi:pimeloyl-ACP methyl ester carboxylesterase